MIQLKLNEYTYTIPTEWREVTLKQFIELAENATQLDGIRLLSIFTGLSYDTLANAPVQTFDLYVMPEMEFLKEEINLFELKRPDRVEIGRFSFDKIEDPSRCKLGQKLYLQQLVNNAMQNNLPHYKLIAPTLSCYYAPYIHPEKKWDEQQVKNFESRVLDMPVVQAYPEANFFLRGYLKWLPKKTTS